jgi:hypothetical protein
MDEVSRDPGEYFQPQRDLAVAGGTGRRRWLFFSQGRSCDQVCEQSVSCGSLPPLWDGPSESLYLKHRQTQM